MYKQGIDLNEIAKERNLSRQTIENHLIAAMRMEWK